MEPELGERGLLVISAMRGIGGISHLPVDELDGVPLGMLRRSATRLHAVCRYRRGVRKSEGVTPADVRCIDVHPYALTEQWSRYADFLLYHEYLHALGISNHGREFRELEALWPDDEAREMGEDFGRHLRERSSKWLWVCPSCGNRHPRARRGNGRYRCRDCKIVLEDVRA
jgi:predicted RNA-binding Zn-ribbon protein involved in translation (DUF1610 family)